MKEDAIVTIDIGQWDWIPGFAAFLDDGTLREEKRGRMVLNIGAMLAAVATNDIAKEDLPYVVAESVMHEVAHILEAWCGVEFNDDRVETLIEKYRHMAEADKREGRGK